MIIGLAFWPIAPAPRRYAVSIIKGQPRLASSLGSQDQKLHDYPWGHLEGRAIEGQQGLKLALIHPLLNITG